MDYFCLYFSKAFDTISQSILQGKLSKLGCVCCSLGKSWLVGWADRVVVNGVTAQVCSPGPSIWANHV